jgi:hypothetical protein
MAVKKLPPVIIEPKTTKANFRLDYAMALNWYNYHWDDADYIQSAKDYIKQTKMSQYTIAVDAASARELRAVGVVGRLILKGQYIEKDTVIKAHNRLDELALKYNTKENTTESAATQTISIQDRIFNTALVYKGSIDLEIDSFLENKFTSDFSVKAFLESNNISGVVAKKIASLYVDEFNDIEEAILGVDPEIKEAYKVYTKPQLRKLADFFKVVLFECNSRDITTKTQRKPRVKKAKSPLKLTENMKFMQEFPELNLKSVLASKIIGASELYTYNVITRKLTVFCAADRDGLGVSGMSILFFDPEKSVCKTLRDPQKFFAGLKTTGKKTMLNAWNMVRAKILKPRARINEDMILFCVN